MKRRRNLLSGLLLYLLTLGLLLQFDWLKILQPKPLISVISGMVILTLSQYHKGMTRGEILTIAQWNAFFGGIVSSLLSLLSLFSAGNTSEFGIPQLAERLIPLIYGSIFYLVIDLVHSESQKNTEQGKGVAFSKNSDIFTPAIANPILISKGLSVRECHVAIKIMEGISNKEIAQQLFISEATVKKHIQNIFKKCEATDRHHFLELYIEWSGN